MGSRILDIACPVCENRDDKRPLCTACKGTGRFKNETKRIKREYPERWMTLIFFLSPTPMDAMNFINKDCGESLSLELSCKHWFACHPECFNLNPMYQKQWEQLNRAIHPNEEE